MVTKVTENIKVSVEVEYEYLHSRPEDYYFLFTYHIRIQNNSEYAVQLLSRHWHIFDSSGRKREVKGEGVVGQQPVIQPGDHYEYESACNLTTELGRMHGSYLMQREADGQQFTVQIPAFDMIAPWRSN